MPKFLYTILVFAALTWWGLISLLTKNPPEGTTLILSVLVLIFITLTATLSIPGYFISQSKAPEFTNLRVIYRRSLRVSLVLSSCIVGFLGLRAFALDTALNLTLYLILCVMIVLHFLSKR